MNLLLIARNLRTEYLKLLKTAFAPRQQELAEAFRSEIEKDGLGEGDIRNCFGKLNDPSKPALRRLSILPQKLRTSPLSAPDPRMGTWVLYQREAEFSWIHGLFTDMEPE